MQAWVDSPAPADSCCWQRFWALICVLGGVGVSGGFVSACQRHFLNVTGLFHRVASLPCSAGLCVMLYLYAAVGIKEAKTK